MEALQDTQIARRAASRSCVARRMSSGCSASRASRTGCRSSMTSARPSTPADASLGWSARSVLAPPPLTARALLGVAAVLAIGAVDLVVGTDIVLAALLVAAGAGRSRWPDAGADTAVVALLGVAIVPIGGASAEEVVLVVAGGAVAVAVAIVRTGTAVALERFRLLVGVADASERASAPGRDEERDGRRAGAGVRRHGRDRRRHVGGRARRSAPRPRPGDRHAVAHRPPPVLGRATGASRTCSPAGWRSRSTTPS